MVRFIYISRFNSGVRNNIGEPIGIRLPLSEVPEFHTHDWQGGGTKYCQIYSAQCVIYGEEVFFYSTRPNGTGATGGTTVLTTAERPLTCKDNIIKHVIE